MNQSFFGKRAFKFFSPLLIVLITNLIFANDSIPRESFELHCKKSDAYFLHNFRDVSYEKLWTSYKKTTSINSKLVVNTTEGVEKHAFLKLNKFISNNIVSIRIKTLKSDGSIVELDSSLVFQKTKGQQKFEGIEYPIPGVEPGDTIETSLTYKQYLKKHQLSDFVDLNTPVPSKSTEYTVRSNPELVLRYKTYNGFPEPQFISNDTILYGVFKVEKKEATPDLEYACYPCDLPHVYYSLDKPEKDMRTWKDVYNQEFNAVTQPMLLDYENSSYYKRWKKRLLSEKDHLTKPEQLAILLDEIYSQMEMEPTVSEEILKSNGYFLKQKRLNPHIIRRLYRQLLEDLEIDYWAVFARSKRAGPIDPYYIRKGEYDHIFFAYDNGKGSIDFLYPNEEHFKYKINEIPTSIYNTKALIVRPSDTEKRKRSDRYINFDLKMAEVDSVDVKLVELPEMGIGQNYTKQIFSCTIDLETKKTFFKHRFSVSGGMSTDLRQFYNMLEKNEDAGNYFDALMEYEGEETTFEIDSINKVQLKSTKPFSYTINSFGRIEGAVKFVSDSIVSISLEKLIQHSQVENQSGESELNTYLDYAYSDFNMYIINFPGDVEFIGLQKNSAEIENDCGKFEFDIKKVGSKQITIQSNYVISKDMIQKEDYEKLDNINERLKDLRSTRLLLKIKDESKV